MKNQYVGDVGDYGKYGLLYFLAEHGIKTGVNWYLTINDCSDDGKFTDYSKDIDYNKPLYEALAKINKKDKDKKVEDVENANIIPGAVFFHEELQTTNLQERTEWFQRSMDTLLKKDVNLIFADPDNGTLREDRKPTFKNGIKYATLEELRRYYDEGKNVVYYCHKGRRKPEKWQEKMKEFNDDGHDAKIIVLTFHRGTQRSFIFAIHPTEFNDYDDQLKAFLKTKWGTHKSQKNKNFPFTLEELK